MFLQPLRRLRREHQGRLRTPLAASVPAPRPRTPRPSNRARTRPDSAVLALCHCPLTAKRTSAPGGWATATASGLTESGPAQAPARSRGPRVWVAPLLVPWSDAGIKALPGGQWTQLVWTGGAEDNVGSASGLPGKGLSSEPHRTRPGCRVRVPSGVLQGMGVRGPPLAPPPRPLCSALPGFIYHLWSRARFLPVASRPPGACSLRGAVFPLSPLYTEHGGHRNGTGGRVCSSSLNLIKSHESRISQTRKPSCEGRCPRPRWEAVPLDWPHAGDWAAPALAPVPPWAPATLSLGSDPLHEDGEALLARWVGRGVRIVHCLGPLPKCATSSHLPTRGPCPGLA